MADRGDFKLDFVAAEPTSYDHATGGGAYHQRIIGQDVVESLEGASFACGDTVTFLTRIAVANDVVDAQELTLGFEFTAHATGKQGVALVDVVDAIDGPVSAAINQAGLDSGTVDDGGSVATVGPLPESLSGPVFVKPSKFLRTVTVTDLEAGETVVLRTDVKLACDGRPAKGNMLARLFTTGAGAQTIPLKHVGGIEPSLPPGGGA
jgi:hypothetical protein